MHHKGKIYHQNKLEREKKIESRAQMMRESTKANPVSQRLVYERYILQGETAQDRLHKPIGTVKQQTLQEMQQELTFQPKIGNGNNREHGNGTSTARAHQGREIHRAPQRHSNHGSMDYSDLDFEYGSQSDFFDPQDTPQQQLLGGEAPWPTYEDDYISNGSGSERGVSASRRNSAPSSASFYLRSKKWEERRQMKIQRDQQARLEEELQHCSFQPKVSSGKDRDSDRDRDRDADEASRSGSIADRSMMWAQRRFVRFNILRH